MFGISSNFLATGNMASEGEKELEVVSGDQGEGKLEVVSGDQAEDSEPPAHHHGKIYEDHLGNHRQYWRDMILGVNDGLISTFLLVAGVSGSGLKPTDILLTAIAGALAGAVSMSAGEYLATKSQNEVLQGEIGLERQHIRDHKAAELKEAREMLETIGIPPAEEELQSQIVAHYESNPEALLKLMIALEFGVVEDETRSPLWAASASGWLFLLGSLPSLIPFAFTHQPGDQALIIACVATALSLLFVGGVKTWATRGNLVIASVENLVVAGVGGVAAYFVGLAFGKLVNKI